MESCIRSAECWGSFLRPKNELVTPEEFALESKKDGSARSQQIAELYKEYQVRLKKNNALDFDDLLMKTVEFLRRRKRCLSIIRTGSAISWWTSTRIPIRPSSVW